MLPDVGRAAAAPASGSSREARAAAAVEHDHIVTIYQVGEDRGVAVPGHAVPQGRDARRPPRARARALAAGRGAAASAGEIAEGLAAAHEQGLIHRDIKPANVWLEAAADGRVKILDFGLARGRRRRRRSSTAAGRDRRHAGVHGPGAGPRRRRSTTAATCSASACVLYRAGTGRLPFDGDDTHRRADGAGDWTDPDAAAAGEPGRARRSCPT